MRTEAFPIPGCLRAGLKNHVPNIAVPSPAASGRSTPTSATAYPVRCWHRRALDQSLAAHLGCLDRTCAPALL